MLITIKLDRRQTGKTTKLIDELYGHCFRSDVEPPRHAIVVLPKNDYKRWYLFNFPKVRRLVEAGLVHLVSSRNIRDQLIGISGDDLRWFWDDYNHCADPFLTPDGYYTATHVESACNPDESEKKYLAMPTLAPMPDWARELYATDPRSSAELFD